MSIKNTRFATIGNCQLAALCQYIKWISPEYECYWLCRKKWRNMKWVRDPNIFSKQQLELHVYDDSVIKEILQTCDVVIYHPNFDSLKMIRENCRDHQELISISPAFIESSRDYIMISKEKKYNTKIKVSNIIKNNKKEKLHFIRDNHPTTLLYLKIMQELCDILDIKYYSQKLYEEILSKQYPTYR